MKIVNARLGFANNSSSSHSMIIVPAREAANISNDYDGDGYNWENFTLVDSDSKLDYLATAIWQQLSHQGDSLSAVVVARELLGLPDWAPSGGIDHQSTFELPAGADGSAIDAGFARAFAEWIQTEGVVVLGGNDNSDGHPLAGDGDAMPFGREQSNPFVAKLDERTGTWTLFNKSTGAKVRMSFEPGEAIELETISGGKKNPRAKAVEENGEPGKLSAPELVDIKITDHCAIGCAYCYQGSTPQGKHASIESIRQIAREMRKAGVLEVALGGGEPTSHPKFAEILEAFSTQGVVANFTTRDLSFLEDSALRERIFASSKSVAVSVSSVAQVKAAEALFASAEAGWRVSLSFQYVMGTSSDAEFAELVEHSVKSRSKLTLLGYKDSGRGAAWRKGEGSVFALRDAKVQSQTSRWIEAARKAMGKSAEYAQICIDTALARECESQLGAQDIPRHLWHKSEGVVSMYVDAVAMTMGVSSYDDPATMSPFDGSWLARFQAWTPSAGEAKKGAINGR